MKIIVGENQKKPFSKDKWITLANDYEMELKEGDEFVLKVGRRYMKFIVSDENEKTL